MTDHPDVYEQFCKGFFAFNKTSSEFSAMAPDQVHEQNNELIEGTGGATRLLNREDDSSLHRWELNCQTSSLLSKIERIDSPHSLIDQRTKITIKIPIPSKNDLQKMSRSSQKLLPLIHFLLIHLLLLTSQILYSQMKYPVQ